MIILYFCSTSASRIPGSEKNFTSDLQYEVKVISLAISCSVYVAYREGFQNVASLSLLACCQ